MKILKNIALATLFTTAFAGNLMSMDNDDFEMVGEPGEIYDTTRMQGRLLTREQSTMSEAVFSALQRLVDEYEFEYTADNVSDKLQQVYEDSQSKVALEQALELSRSKVSQLEIENEAYEGEILDLRCYKGIHEKTIERLKEETRKEFLIEGLIKLQQKKKIKVPSGTNLRTDEGQKEFLKAYEELYAKFATLEAQKLSRDEELETFLTDSGISCEMPGYVKGDAVANVHALYELLPQTFTDMAELERKLKAATQRISELEEAAKFSSNF